MRKCLILILVAFNCVSAQWFHQSPAYPLTEFQEIALIDSNHATIVGSMGTIYRTTNGGLGWAKQNSGATNHLYDVCFTDINTGTVVGEGGVILRTTNGGESWIRQVSGTNLKLFGVSFYNTNIGIVVGINGTILTTSDGGREWSPQACPVNYYMQDVQLVSENVGWTIGGGKILKTTDAGKTWIDQPNPSTSPFLWRLSFSDPQNGMVCGQYQILKTTDGGNNWLNISKSGYGFLTGVSVIDSNNAFLVVEQTVLKTTDGGNTFILKAFYEIRSVRAVSFLKNSTGMIAGYDTGILKTTDNGESWRVLSWGGINLEAVSFYDRNLGITVGKNFAFITTDGGKIWKRNSETISNSLHAAYIVNPENIFAVGENGTIIKSTDLGTTWHIQNSGTSESLNAIHFENSYLGYVTEKNGSILKTTDGGITWIKKYIGEIKITGVVATDENNVFVISENPACLFKSTDGGNIWSIQLSGVAAIFSDISFTDPRHGVVLGIPSNTGKSKILITRNGGVDWTIRETEQNIRLLSVCMIDSLNIATVGEEGLNLRTTDGGDVWLEQYSWTKKRLLDISFSDPDYGTIVGEDFTIIRTTSGSITSVDNKVDVFSTPNYYLDQNYPNPFNPTTSIQYSVSSLPNGTVGSQYVSLKIYDILGNEVETLVNEVQPAGTYKVGFDATPFSSGVYFYQLRQNNSVITKKMILLR